MSSVFGRLLSLYSIHENQCHLVGKCKLLTIFTFSKFIEYLQFFKKKMYVKFSIDFNCLCFVILSKPVYWWSVFWHCVAMCFITINVPTTPCYTIAYFYVHSLLVYLDPFSLTFWWWVGILLLACWLSYNDICSCITRNILRRAVESDAMFKSNQILAQNYFL